jgi:hypothetical protein
VLLLFGGGLSLAAAVSANGVDAFIGEQFRGLAGVPLWVLVGVITLVIVWMTELTSNTATAAALVPIIGGVASCWGLDPMVLAVPAALAATCAFALPVATPPNAIVFGSGHVTVAQMARAGRRAQRARDRADHGLRRDAGRPGPRLTAGDFDAGGGDPAPQREGCGGASRVSWPRRTRPRPRRRSGPRAGSARSRPRWR